MQEIKTFFANRHQSISISRDLGIEHTNKARNSAVENVSRRYFLPMDDTKNCTFRVTFNIPLEELEQNDSKKERDQRSTAGVPSEHKEAGKPIIQ